MYPIPRDIRICFFGDSLVNGTRDETYQGWVGRVAERCRALGMDLTTYNLGIRRDTSADILARWRGEAERRLPAHVDGRLVFSFGINDCVEESGRMRVAPAESLRNAEKILAEAAKWKPTLMIGPPALAPNSLGGINVRIWQLSLGLQGVCSALKVPFLDLHALLVDEQEWEQEVHAGDAVHPCGDGYQRMADLIMDWPEWSEWLR